MRSRDKKERENNKFRRKKKRLNSELGGVYEYESTDNEFKEDIPQADYQKALEDLWNTIDELPLSIHPFSLFQSSVQVYNSVRDIKSNAKNVISEEKLTEILNATAILIVGQKSAPKGDKNYRKEIDAFHQLSNSIRQYSLGKIVAASMLCLIGTLLIIVSGITAAVTLGCMIPVGILGGMLGISMIAGGISASLSGVLGVSCLMSSGIFFRNMIEKNPLRQAMERVENSAREVYSCRK
jgi:hypothetical protein